MIEVCNFPTCNSFPQSNGMCVAHSKYADLKIERPAIKKIAAKSKTMTINHKEYKKIVVEMLLVSNKCEINSDVCTHTAQGLHHMRGRGEFLLDKRYLKRACNACNSFIESNPDWATENGFLLTRFSPIDKI